MPGQRLPMRKIRDVLRLSAGGMSKRGKREWQHVRERRRRAVRRASLVPLNKEAEIFNISDSGWIH
jgi:hypothetical protein